MDDIRGQGTVAQGDNGNDAAESEVAEVGPRVASGPQLALIPLCGQSRSAGLVRRDSSSFFQPALNVLKQLNKNDLSFYLFNRECTIRKACLFMAGAPAFGKFVLLLVFLNCVTLAMEPGPCDEECQKSEYMRALFITDTIFTACFTLEILCQAIAHCFFLGPSAYLHDGWNWIDVLSTASGYIAFLPLTDSGSGLNGLRGLRAIRPLRALKAIPGLRRLVQCLLEVVPLLLDVLFLLVWVFFAFGIIALNIFMGALHRRCAYLTTAAAPPPLPTAPPWSNGSNRATAATIAAAGTFLSSNSSLNLSISDSSGGGSGGARGGGSGAAGGSWSLVPGLENTPCSSSGSGGSFKCPMEYGGFAVSCRGKYDNPNFDYTGFDNFGMAAFNIFAVLTLDGWSEQQLYPLWSAMGPGLPITFFSLLVLFGAFFAMQLVVAIMSSKFAQLEALARHRGGVSRSTTSNLQQLEDAEEDEDEFGGGSASVTTIARPPPQPPQPSPSRSIMGRITAAIVAGAAATVRRYSACKRAVLVWAYNVRLRHLQPLHRVRLPPWRRRAHTVVQHEMFVRLMTGLILVNTIALAMDHYGIEPTWARAIDLINNILTYIFIIELVLKHVAVGFLRYWTDPWDILDGVVVGVSIAEIILVATGGNKTGTQAFRTLRVLRILRTLKLLRRIKSLHRLIKLVMKGFRALGNFLLLASLFIFIFAVMGLHQFGGLWSFQPAANLDDLDGSRSNFDTLWQSGYTVFQILTCDDWLRIAWNGMRGSGNAAVLYFAVWVIIGNFTLLSLFLAILITSFNTADEDDEGEAADEDEETDEEGEPYTPGPARSSVATIDSRHAAHQNLRRRVRGGGGGRVGSDDVSRNVAVGGAGAGDSNSNGHGGGSGGGGATNALQQRVVERVSERLDPARVKIMKRWLVMIGFTHGMKPYEVDSIVQELDARLAFDPDSIRLDSSFTTPHRLHRRSAPLAGLQRFSTIRRITTNRTSDGGSPAAAAVAAVPPAEIENTDTNADIDIDAQRSSARRMPAGVASLRRFTAALGASPAVSTSSRGTAVAAAAAAAGGLDSGYGMTVDQHGVVVGCSADHSPRTTRGSLQSAGLPTALRAAIAASVITANGVSSAGDGDGNREDGGLSNIKLGGYPASVKLAGDMSAAQTPAFASGPIPVVMPERPSGGGVGLVLERLAHAVRRLGGVGSIPTAATPRASSPGMAARYDGASLPLPPLSYAAAARRRSVGGLDAHHPRASYNGGGGTVANVAAAFWHNNHSNYHNHHIPHGRKRLGRPLAALQADREDSWAMLLPRSEALRRYQRMQQQHLQRVEEAWAQERFRSWLKDSHLAAGGGGIVDGGDTGSGDLTAMATPAPQPSSRYHAAAVTVTGTGDGTSTPLPTSDEASTSEFAGVSHTGMMEDDGGVEGLSPFRRHLGLRLLMRNRSAPALRLAQEGVLRGAVGGLSLFGTTWRSRRSRGGAAAAAAASTSPYSTCDGVTDNARNVDGAAGGGGGGGSDGGSHGPLGQTVGSHQPSELQPLSFGMSHHRLNSGGYSAVLYSTDDGILNDLSASIPRRPSTASQPPLSPSSTFHPHSHLRTHAQMQLASPSSKRRLMSWNSMPRMQSHPSFPSAPPSPPQQPLSPMSVQSSGTTRPKGAGIPHAGGTFVMSGLGVSSVLPFNDSGPQQRLPTSPCGGEETKDAKVRHAEEEPERELRTAGLDRAAGSAAAPPVILPSTRTTTTMTSMSASTVAHALQGRRREMESQWQACGAAAVTLAAAAPVVRQLSRFRPPPLVIPGGGNTNQPPPRNERLKGEDGDVVTAVSAVADERAAGAPGSAPVAVSTPDAAESVDDNSDSSSAIRRRLLQPAAVAPPPFATAIRSRCRSISRGSRLSSRNRIQLPGDDNPSFALDPDQNLGLAPGRSSAASISDGCTSSCLASPSSAVLMRMASAMNRFTYGAAVMEPEGGMKEYDSVGDGREDSYSTSEDRAGARTATSTENILPTLTPPPNIKARGSCGEENDGEEHIAGSCGAATAAGATIAACAGSIAIAGNAFSFTAANCAAKRLLLASRGGGGGGGGNSSDDGEQWLSGYAYAASNMNPVYDHVYGEQEPEVDEQLEVASIIGSPRPGSHSTHAFTAVYGNPLASHSSLGSGAASPVNIVRQKPPHSNEILGGMPSSKSPAAMPPPAAVSSAAADDNGRQLRSPTSMGSSIFPAAEILSAAVAAASADVPTNDDGTEVALSATAHPAVQAVVQSGAASASLDQASLPAPAKLPRSVDGFDSTPIYPGISTVAVLESQHEKCSWIPTIDATPAERNGAGNGSLADGGLPPAPPPMVLGGPRVTVATATAATATAAIATAATATAAIATAATAIAATALPFTKCLSGRNENSTTWAAATPSAAATNERSHSSNGGGGSSSKNGDDGDVADAVTLPVDGAGSSLRRTSAKTSATPHAVSEPGFGWPSPKAEVVGDQLVLHPEGSKRLQATLASPRTQLRLLDATKDSQRAQAAVADSAAAVATPASTLTQVHGTPISGSGSEIAPPMDQWTGSGGGAGGAMKGLQYRCGSGPVAEAAEGWGSPTDGSSGEYGSLRGMNTTRRLNNYGCSYSWVGGPTAAGHGISYHSVRRDRKRPFGFSGCSDNIGTNDKPLTHGSRTEMAKQVLQNLLRLSGQRAAAAKGYESRMGGAGRESEALDGGVFSSPCSPRGSNNCQERFARRHGRCSGASVGWHRPQGCTSGGGYGGGDSGGGSSDPDSRTPPGPLCEGLLSRNATSSPAAQASLSPGRVATDTSAPAGDSDAATQRMSPFTANHPVSVAAAAATAAAKPQRRFLRTFSAAASSSRSSATVVAVSAGSGTEPAQERQMDPERHRGLTRRTLHSPLALAAQEEAANALSQGASPRWPPPSPPLLRTSLPLPSPSQPPPPPRPRPLQHQQHQQRRLLHSSSSRHHSSRTERVAAAVAAAAARYSGSGARKSGTGGDMTKFSVAWAREHGPQNAQEMEEALFAPLQRGRSCRARGNLKGSSYTRLNDDAGGGGNNGRQLLGSISRMSRSIVAGSDGGADSQHHHHQQMQQCGLESGSWASNGGRAAAAAVDSAIRTNPNSLGHHTGPGMPDVDVGARGRVGSDVDGGRHLFAAEVTAAGNVGDGRGGGRDGGGDSDGDKIRPDADADTDADADAITVAIARPSPPPSPPPPPLAIDIPRHHHHGLQIRVDEDEEGEEADTDTDTGSKSKESTLRYVSGVDGSKDPAPYLAYPALCCIDGRTRVRQIASAIILHRWFDYGILAVILGSSAILAVDSPRLERSSPLGRAVAILDIIFTAIFTLEMLIKVLAKGLILHRHAYLRNGWDILDFVIVTTSLLSLGLSAGGVGGSSTSSALKGVRLVRALRPLRLVRRLRGMRRVVETLIRSIPTLSEVLLFGVFQFGLFGILGVQLFAGKMSVCSQEVINGTRVEHKSQCVQGVTYVCGEYDMCPDPGSEAVRWWGPKLRNFDNLGSALLTLFTVVTLDGYMAVARSCMDAVGVDHVPEENHAPYMGLYVLVFIFLGSFFWVNLLVSVIIDHYARIVAEEGDLLISKQAKEYIRIFQFERNGKDDWKGGCPADASRLRRFCWKVASHPHFDNAVTANIIINILAMAMVYNDTPRAYDVALALVNVVCTCGFAVEAWFKIVALGFWKYIRDHWNKLDLFIIAVSVPDIVSTFTPMSAATGFVTVLRLLRVFRMFKLIKNARGLRTLFNTLIASSPAIANVGSLLLLIMYIYAVIGMNMYGNYGSPFDQSGSHATYNNIGAAMATQFRLFTGDGWGDLMATGMNCDDNQYQCHTGASALGAAVFFCSFVLVAIFIMLNLVIAVVVDNFIDNAQMEGLLKTTNFVDVLKMVITLRVFVLLMRHKIDTVRKLHRASQLSVPASSRLLIGRRARSRNIHSSGPATPTTPAAAPAAGSGGGSVTGGSLSMLNLGAIGFGGSSGFWSPRSVSGSQRSFEFIPRLARAVTRMGIGGGGGGSSNGFGFLTSTDGSGGEDAVCGGGGGGGGGGGAAAATPLLSQPGASYIRTNSNMSYGQPPMPPPSPPRRSPLSTIGSVLPRGHNGPPLMAAAAVARTASLQEDIAVDGTDGDDGRDGDNGCGIRSSSYSGASGGCGGNSRPPRGASVFRELRKQVLRQRGRQSMLSLRKGGLGLSGGDGIDEQPSPSDGVGCDLSSVVGNDHGTALPPRPSPRPSPRSSPQTNTPAAAAAAAEDDFPGRESAAS